MNLLSGFASALWDVVPGVALVAVVLVVFALGCGKAIATMGSEPPVVEPTAPRPRVPAQVRTLARSAERRTGPARVALPPAEDGVMRVARPHNAQVRPDQDRHRSLPDPERVVPERQGPATCPQQPRASERPAEGRGLHRLLKIYDGPSNRDGFNGWCWWVQCDQGCVSHDLPSHVDALAWMDLHADIENSIDTFAPRASS